MVDEWRAKGGSGPRTTTIYRIDMDVLRKLNAESEAMWKEADGRSDALTPQGSLGDTVSPPGVTPEASRGDTVSPKPSTEPSDNRQHARAGAREVVSISNFKKEARYDRSLPLYQRLTIPPRNHDPEGLRARMVDAASGNDPDMVKADYCQYYATKDDIHDVVEHFMSWLRKIAQSRKGGRHR